MNATRNRIASRRQLRCLTLYTVTSGDRVILETVDGTAALNRARSFNSTTWGLLPEAVIRVADFVQVARESEVA